MPDELSEDQLQEIGARGAREAIEAAKTNAARDAYGDSAAAGGGAHARAAAPHPYSAEAVISRVHSKLEKGEGFNRPADKMDVNLFAVARLREAVSFQREPHPELGLGAGGSYRGDGGPNDRRQVDARVESRKRARERMGA